MDIDLTKLFSCCHNGEVESIHQFPLLDSHPDNELAELRIIQALYSETPLDFKNKKVLDMTNPKDKKKQVREFLDYHLSQYEDQSFIDGVRKLIYFQQGLGRPASVGKEFYPEPQIRFVTRIITEWCDEKEEEFRNKKIVFKKEDNLTLSNLTTKLNDLLRESLFYDLIDGGFISQDSDKESFMWIFGGAKKPNKLKKIVWVKANSKVGKNINKASLLDLLKVIGVSYNEYRDKKKLDTLFAKPNSELMKFTSANYNNFTTKKEKSEYHTQLLAMIK